MSESCFRGDGFRSRRTRGAPPATCETPADLAAWLGYVAALPPEWRRAIRLPPLADLPFGWLAIAAAARTAAVEHGLPLARWFVDGTGELLASLAPDPPPLTPTWRSGMLLVGAWMASSAITCMACGGGRALRRRAPMPDGDRGPFVRVCADCLGLEMPWPTLVRRFDPRRRGLPGIP